MKDKNKKTQIKTQNQTALRGYGLPSATITFPVLGEGVAAMVFKAVTDEVDTRTVQTNDIYFVITKINLIHRCRGPPVSLRFGHRAFYKVHLNLEFAQNAPELCLGKAPKLDFNLTVPRTVIHYRVAASLPARGRLG